MVIAQNMIRIVLVTIVPWTGRIMKGIIFITLCAAACHLSKGLSTLGRPHSLTVFFQISKIGIGSEIVCLQSQTDFGKISRTGTDGLFQSIFQFLDATGNRVRRICDTIGLLRISGVVGSFWVPCPELSCIITARIRST